jgi:hypothetical protein
MAFITVGRIPALPAGLPGRRQKLASPVAQGRGDRLGLERDAARKFLEALSAGYSEFWMPGPLRFSGYSTSSTLFSEP